LDQNDVVVSRYQCPTFPSTDFIREMIEFEADLKNVDVTEITAKIDKRYVMEV
jgi:hypothetical protein